MRKIFWQIARCKRDAKPREIRYNEKGRIFGRENPPVGECLPSHPNNRNGRAVRRNKKGTNIMKKMEQLYEGKAKKVFATDDPDVVIVDYKDDATAFNGVKKGTISGKGVINNRMSNHMFKILEQHGVKTHLVEELSDRETAVKKVSIVPLEVIIRNIAAGSFSKRYGVEEGRKLAIPTIEFSYKNDDLGDPLINDYHALALDLATVDEIETIKKMAFKVNEVMVDYFDKHNVILVDFKLEFGRYKGEIVLADEISPDTCRLWDKDTKEKLDKDRFRRDMGGVEEAYEEMARRLGLQ
jgi:phosphoribosylaminoimidazole-succinocarboxamide synthase